MSQILLNFLSNAFKLTPKSGDIEVELKIIDDKEQKTSNSVSDEHSEPVLP
jgi:signal transduction histidine kinase